MDCNYHKVLFKLNEKVWEKIGIRYDWAYFMHWLGDESYLDNTYTEVFEEVLGITLTEEQKRIVEKKGRNLEVAIRIWECPTKKCLEMKIYTYIEGQLKQKGLEEIVGNSC